MPRKKLKVDETELRWTKRQQALLAHLVQHGGTVEQAGQAVGLSRSAVYRTYGHREFKSALLDRLRGELPRLGADALRRVAVLASEAQSEYVRLHAAKDILDRAGIGPTLSYGGGAARLVITLLPVADEGAGRVGPVIEGTSRVVALNGEPMDGGR